MSETKETAAPEQTQAPSVSVNDLVNVYNIIDLASKRGAFQANELSSVGAVANKVKEFVDHVQAAQKAAADAKGGADVDVTPETPAPEGAE
ncbi:MAG: hypothetical protein H8D95_01335 [Candidatus Endolissoclinum sp.]|nr:hypothetical protein [Candidatus Endolissoclinum sp.]